MEAWKYGPVLRGEYNRNSIYGSMKIRREGRANKNFEIFNEFIGKRIHQDIGDLVDESHEHSKWKNNEDNILKRNKTIYYTLEDFVNEDFNHAIGA